MPASATAELRSAVVRPRGRVHRHRRSSPAASCSAWPSTSAWPGSSATGSAPSSAGSPASARYVVPIALVCVGVALVRKGRSEHRVRLVVGWGLGTVAVLGLLHIVPRAPIGISDLDDVGRAGGWIGALVGAPLRALHRHARRGRRARRRAPRVDHADHRHVGARAARARTRRTTRARPRPRRRRSPASPAGPSRKVRTALGNMASLRSERDATPGGTPLPPPAFQPPQLYDADVDDDWSDDQAEARPHGEAAAAATGLVRRRRGRAVRARARPGGAAWRVDAAAGQLPHPLGRAGGQPGRGRGARPHAGRVAQLARRRDAPHRPDRRPHGHPLRARARLRRQGRPGAQPQPRHRLRDGRHRRAHPRPDPGSFGDRRRGAQPHPSAGQPRRHHGLGGGQVGHAPARRRRRQGHRRPLGVPQPGHHAAPADRRHHRRRQVQRDQLHHHVAAHAHDARAGAS